MSLGKRIKELRVKKGMTQLELANILFVNDRTISKWEQERGNPDVNTIPDLANALGVSIDYLMTGQEYSPKEEDNALKAIEYFEYLIEQPLTEDYLRRSISKQVQQNDIEKIKDALDKCFEVYLKKNKKPYAKDDIRNALSKLGGILHYQSLSPIDAKKNMLSSYIMKNTSRYTLDEKIECEKMINDLLGVVVENGNENKTLKTLDSLYRYSCSHKLDICSFRAMCQVLIQEHEFQKELERRVSDGFLEELPSAPSEINNEIQVINESLINKDDSSVRESLVNGIDLLYRYVFESIDKDLQGKVPNILKYYNNLYVILGKFMNIRNYNCTKRLIDTYGKRSMAKPSLHDIDDFYKLLESMLGKLENHKRSAFRNYNKAYFEKIVDKANK